MTATLRPILAPSALKWSPICTTSYLAGAIINAKKGVGLSSKLCNIGNANANVLPLPVYARAIISFPANV